MNPIRINQVAKEVRETIAGLVAAGKIKNGCAVPKIMKALKKAGSKATLDEVNAAVEKDMKAGKLVRGKGQGGSYRLAGTPFVQAVWGSKSGNVKGVWAEKHKANQFVSKAKGVKRGPRNKAAVAETTGAIS